MSATSVAIQAIGTLLKAGDGGTPAAVKASHTFGTSNSQIKFTAVTAGTAGNSITVAIVVAGTNTALSISVSGNAITVNSATDGGGLATSTPNDIIAAIYASTTASALVVASEGTGTGTGIIVAATSTALSGGAAGAEVFTTIGGVISISGPNLKTDIIDVTHMDSPNFTKEFLPTLIDPGELKFDIQFVPTITTGHRAIITDLQNRTKRNFQLQFPDSTPSVLSTAGYYTDFAITENYNDVIKASVTIKLTSSFTWGD